MKASQILLSVIALAVLSACGNKSSDSKQEVGVPGQVLPPVAAPNGNLPMTPFPTFPSNPANPTNPMNPLDPNNSQAQNPNYFGVVCTVQTLQVGEGKFLFLKYQTQKPRGFMNALSFNLRKTETKRLGTGSASRNFGAMSARFEPARSNAQPTLEIAVENFDGKISATTKGFAGRDVVLTMDDKEAGKSLRVQCSPTTRMAIANQNLRAVSCNGAIFADGRRDDGRRQDRAMRIDQVITPADFAASSPLLQRPNLEFSDLSFGAYRGAEGGDESMMVTAQTDRSERMIDFNANIYSPMEVTYNNRNNDYSMKLVCTPY